MGSRGSICSNRRCAATYPWSLADLNVGWFLCWAGHHGDSNAGRVGLLCVILSIVGIGMARTSPSGRLRTNAQKRGYSLADLKSDSRSSTKYRGRVEWIVVRSTLQVGRGECCNCLRINIVGKLRRQV